MTKEEVVKVLKDNNYEIQMENSVIFVFLDRYCAEEINKVSTLIKKYKGSIGFRPKKEEVNGNKE